MNWNITFPSCLHPINSKICPGNPFLNTTLSHNSKSITSSIQSYIFHNCVPFLGFDASIHPRHHFYSVIIIFVLKQIYLLDTEKTSPYFSSQEGKNSFLTLLGYSSSLMIPPRILINFTNPWAPTWNITLSPATEKINLSSLMLCMIFRNSNTSC